MMEKDICTIDEVKYNQDDAALMEKHICTIDEVKRRYLKSEIS